MAWIKIDHVLPDKPEVVSIATALNLDVDTVVGKLLRFWIWADGVTETGNALSVTRTWLDRHVHCAGFTDLLLEVGWLHGDDGAFSIPHFDRHNSQTAKRRALTAARAQKHRNAKVTHKALPEKRREEKKKEVPKGTSAKGKPSQPKPQKPDLLWDAIQQQFWPDGVPTGDKARCGRIVRDLREQGAMPEEIAKRCKRYTILWPKATLTAEALRKHWSHFEESHYEAERARGSESKSASSSRGGKGRGARDGEYEYDHGDPPII